MLIIQLDNAVNLKKMLQNDHILAKIGADTAENEQHFAEILPIGRWVAGPRGRRGLSFSPSVQRPRVHLRVQQRLPLRWRSVEADLYRDSLAGGGAEVKGNER